MKRLIPLWISALGGFVLIVAYFIPHTQGWGETAAIWFDIMAAIAFVLGGGNLLKMQFKKVSDKAPGWGYSLVTIIAFLTMLYVGLSKWGAPPAPNQEHLGETFAHVPVASIPDSLVFTVPGSIPAPPDDPDADLDKRIGALHHSVREQIGESNGNMTFRGWMRRDQFITLIGHMDQLAWRCTVETLYIASQPGGPLKPGGSPLVTYYSEFEALAIKGRMTAEQRDALLGFGGDATWQAAVTELYDRTQAVTGVEVEGLPPGVEAGDLPGNVTFEAATKMLRVTGPMTVGQRESLAELFPIARPMDQAGRDSFLAGLRAIGDLAPEQVAAFNVVMDGQWTVDQLRTKLDDAGDPVVVDKGFCELYEEQQAGVTDIDPKKTVGPDLKLNPQQVAALEAFAADRAMKPGVLWDRLANAGETKRQQQDAFWEFMTSAPTIGDRGKAIAFAMLKATDDDDAGFSLTVAQRDLLLDANRQQMAWRGAVGRLFIDAHAIKFPWSGEYRAQGAPFWWLYEYAFKPLQATIFAMLAFYVASAAFRAFRAKNIEAILLLGTAFIILLGRTFAGVFLTAWVPEWASALKIENMTLYIMQVFNTAGNRAIMIGIALGIASTSLKVLLGVDRSYLGSGDD